MKDIFTIRRMNDAWHVLNAAGEPVKNGMHQPFVFARRDAAVAFCQSFGVNYRVEE